MHLGLLPLLSGQLDRLSDGIQLLGLTRNKHLLLLQHHLILLIKGLIVQILSFSIPWPMFIVQLLHALTYVS